MLACLLHMDISDNFAARATIDDIPVKHSLDAQTQYSIL